MPKTRGYARTIFFDWGPAFVAFLMFVVGIVWGVSLLHLDFFSDYRQYVPEYPGSQNTQTHTDYGGLHTSEPFEVKVSFDTSDRPEAVFTFYKDALQRSTSVSWDVEEVKQGPTYISFYGVQPNKYNYTMYNFDIDTSQRNSVTHVTIIRSWTPGM